MTNKEAIEVIKSMGLITDVMTHGARRKSLYEALNLAIEVLEERPQGEWQLHGMICYCSECGHECGESGDNFCGNCGADMRGSRE